MILSSVSLPDVFAPKNSRKFNLCAPCKNVHRCARVAQQIDQILRFLLRGRGNNSDICKMASTSFMHSSSSGGQAPNPPPRAHSRPNQPPPLPSAPPVPPTRSFSIAICKYSDSQHSWRGNYTVPRSSPIDEAKSTMIKLSPISMGTQAAQVLKPGAFNGESFLSNFESLFKPLEELPPPILFYRRDK